MVAIQNGVVPERLIRMHLDVGLTKVDSWETIEANWPGLGDPTHGIVVGGQFYFIANSRLGNTARAVPIASLLSARCRGSKHYFQNSAQSSTSSLCG